MQFIHSLKKNKSNSIIIMICNVMNNCSVSITNITIFGAESIIFKILKLLFTSITNLMKDIQH